MKRLSKFLKEYTTKAISKIDLGAKPPDDPSQIVIIGLLALAIWAGFDLDPAYLDLAQLVRACLQRR